MNKDVVMITSFNRPEFVQLNLEHLATNTGFRELHYVFAQDRGSAREHEVRRVIGNFVERYGVSYDIVTPTKEAAHASIMKQSYNLYNGYKHCTEITDGLIYMVEDDVLVADRFIEWGRRIHTACNPFAAIGTRNNNRRVPKTSYVDYYLLDSYQSLGVVWQKASLVALLATFTPAYWQDPFNYCKRMYPDSPIGQGFVEQDGLIHRYIKAHKKQVAFSTMGFAFHAGFYGKSRGKRVTGTVGQKVDKLRAIVYNTDQMRNNAANEAMFLDSMPVPLEITNWDGGLREIII